MNRANATDPMVGSVLDGRYEVLARVARGGMATVYRALDLRLARTVAVKVMHDGLGDDADFAAKFDREARHAATLTNPHLVSVFDQGVDDGRPFMVMEYVHGRTLRYLLNREAPLSPEQMLEIAEAMASALATAHEAGLVHRDIKPENVLISDQGDIKVADFGLARAVTAHTNTASQGLLIGTVSYLPPELLTIGRADSRSDVYSTGVVMYEMLTGAKPYTGETPIQVAWSHVHHDIPPPSQAAKPGHVPDYLDALVVACTRRESDQRPADARIMLDMVRQARSAMADGVSSDPALVSQFLATVPATGDATPQAASPASAGPPRPVSPHPRSASSAPSPRSRASSSSANSARILTRPTPGSAPTARVGVTRALANSAAASKVVAHADLDAGDDNVPTVTVGRPPRPRSQSTPVFPHISHDPVHRRRRGFVVVILVLVLALMAGAAAYYYASRVRWTASPALLNLTQAEAQTAATNSGVQVTFDEEYSETVAKGLVMKVDPPAGTRVRKGSSVHAVISRGPERYPMPTVVGLSKDAATAALTQNSLAAGQVTSRYDEKVPADIVLQASVEPGTALKKGTPVDMVISRGPKPIPIASWVGKNADEATKALTSLGFKVTSDKQHHDSVPQGNVISQTPSGGEGKKGDSIALVISLGPVLVPIPKVTGLSEAAARAKLTAAGFQVAVHYNTASWLRLNIVAGQDPAANKSVPKGSKVTIFIS